MARVKKKLNIFTHQKQNTMSEIHETIQESLEQADKSSINSKVALFVAITATVMALCNVKDGNIVQAMSQAQAHYINSWNYFDTKSTKQLIAENTLEILKMQSPAVSEDIIKKYEDRIARYDKEKAESDLQNGNADLIGFGRPFINNPDFVLRLKNDFPLSNTLDTSTFYSGGEKGYTDYPVHEQETVTA